MNSPNIIGREESGETPKILQKIYLLQFLQHVSRGRYASS